MTIELFADHYEWTVTAGGTDSPTAGTSETFTVSSATGAPAATSGLSQFRVIDKSDANIPPEVITITNVSGTTWTATRGAEGGAPWAHAANWTAVPVLTAAGLVSFGRQMSFAYTSPSAMTPPTAANTYSSPVVTVSPDAGYAGLVNVLTVQGVFAGTFGTSETVTVQLTPTWSDGTTGSGTTFALTASGVQNNTQIANASFLFPLHKSGTYITSLAVSVKSSQASSAATVILKIEGSEQL